MADRSVFECGICRESYDDVRHTPLHLPCGHVFCEECLVRLSRVDDLKCPFHKLKLTKTVQELPRLLTLIKYLPVSKPKEFLCSLHPRKKVKYRCRVHDVYLCSDCIIGHTDHAVENFSVTPTAVRAQSEELKKAVNKRCSLLADARKVLDAEERKVKSNYEQQVRSVMSVYDEAVAALNAKRKEMVSALKDNLVRQLQQLDQDKSRLSRLLEAATALSSRISKCSLDSNWEATIRSVEEVNAEVKRFEEWKSSDLPLFLFEDAVKITDNSAVVAKMRNGEVKSRDIQKTAVRTPGWDSLSGKFWICQDCSMPNSPDVQQCTRCAPKAEVIDFSRSLGNPVQSPKTASHVEGTSGFEAKASKYRGDRDGMELTRKPSFKSGSKVTTETLKAQGEPGLLTKRQPRGRKHSRYNSVRKRNNSF